MGNDQIAGRLLSNAACRSLAPSFVTLLECASCETGANMVNTIELLDKTVEDCDTVATCHYIQAEGNKNRRIWLGVPALVLNIVVGSVLVANLGAVISD